MRVEMIQENKRERYEVLSRALVVAYQEKKAVLVTQNGEFVGTFIPNHDEHTIYIEPNGICLVKGEFVSFDDPEEYNWEDCIFEVIDTDNIQITITRD